MEFTECEVSGQLKATGNKGDYWLDDSEKFIRIVRVVATPAGPSSRILGLFKTVEEAKDTANQLDEAGL